MGQKKLVAALVMFGKEVSSAEAKELLEKDGRYRGADMTELLALSLQYKHPYFNAYIHNPKVTEIGNGLSVVEYYLNQDSDSEAGSIATALNSGFFDLKSIPGWSPYMTAHIYDRDIRTLKLKQEFPYGEIKNDTRYYTSAVFLVIKNDTL